MTEREKSQLGILYDANHNEQLLALRLQCQKLCLKYNKIPPDKLKKRAKFIKKIFASIGSNAVIEHGFWCVFGDNITIGNNFFANHNLIILDTAKIKIGDNVFIAPNCGLYCAGHPLDVERRNEGLEYAYPITIGDNVWIGANVCILPGVTIGSNTVIGAGSVVTASIPENSLAFGNPCRVHRSISDDDRFQYCVPNY